MTKRYLAIDPGDKRTGLAVGDDELMQAGPVGAIITSSEEERLTQLLKHIDEQAPDALIMGMPLNMDGTESPGSKKARALAAMLSAETGLSVHMVDERLTSFEADQLMAQSGLTHKQKKARRDALAATAILQDFLNSRALDDHDH